MTTSDLTKETYTGTVKFYNEEKGYGFITPENEKNEEIFIKDNMASKNLGKKDSQMESEYTFQRSA